jgi:hypothetical protein
MTTIKTYISLFGLMLLFGLPLGAQSYKLSTPLLPSNNSLAEQSVGGFLGIGPNWQGGTHYVECPGCEFLDGTATGFTFGLVYDRKLSNSFFWGGMLSLDIMNISSSFREIESVEVQDAVSGEDTYANIDFKHTADMKLTYLGLAPYLAYYPAGWLTFRVAPKISFPIYSNIKHIKAINDYTTVINGVEGTIQYDGEDGKVVQDTEVPDLTSPLIGTDMTMMFNTTPGPNVMLSLGYTQYIPFMTTSSFGEDFVISSWRIFAEFKYILEGSYGFSSPK